MVRIFLLGVPQCLLPPLVFIATIHCFTFRFILFIYLASLLSLLNETQVEVIHLALCQLVRSVDTYWPEISEALPTLEAFYETPSFKERNLIALLISKVAMFVPSVRSIHLFNVALGVLSLECLQ